MESSALRLWHCKSLWPVPQEMLWCCPCSLLHQAFMLQAHPRAFYTCLLFIFHSALLNRAAPCHHALPCRAAPRAVQGEPLPAWALQVKPCSVHPAWQAEHRAGATCPLIKTWSQFSGVKPVLTLILRKSCLWDCSSAAWGCEVVNSLSNCISSLNGADVAIFSSLSSLCTWIWFLNFFFLP